MSCMRGARRNWFPLRAEALAPTGNCSPNRLLQQTFAANVRSLDAETFLRAFKGEAIVAEAGAC